MVDVFFTQILRSRNVYICPQPPDTSGNHLRTDVRDMSDTPPPHERFVKSPSEIDLAHLQRLGFETRTSGHVSIWLHGREETRLAGYPCASAQGSRRSHGGLQRICFQESDVGQRACERCGRRADYTHHQSFRRVHEFSFSTASTRPGRDLFF